MDYFETVALFASWLIFLFFIKNMFQKKGKSKINKHFNVCMGIMLAVGSLIISYSSPIGDYLMSLILYAIFLFLIQFITKKFYIFSPSKKSFLEICGTVSNNNKIFDKKSSIFNVIHDYLNQSEEEILFHNLYFQNINLKDWYTFFFATLTSTIFFLSIETRNFEFLREIINNLPFEQLKEESTYYLSTILVFVVPTIFIYLLSFVYLQYKKSSFLNIYYKNFLFNLSTGVLFNVVAVLLSFITYAIFLLILSLITQSSNEQIISLFTYLISPIEIKNLYDLNNLKGNQFPLSCLYFTLAIAGFVVFSVAHKYKEQKRNVEKLHQNFEKIYKHWFTKNKVYINFDIHDYQTKSKVKNFSSALFELRGLFNSENVYNLNIFIYFYEAALKLIIIIFIAGIVTLIINPTYSLSFLISFLAFLFLALLLAVSIFNVFEMSEFVK